MRNGYINPAIRRLRDRVVGVASLEKRLEQAASAEKLLNELDPNHSYTCQYLCSRITRHPEPCPAESVSGKDARHDLRLFVEDVSDAANVPAEAAGERVATIDDLCEQLDVSRKTIARWRKQGLVSRRFVFDGRKRIGFLQSSVDRFVRQSAGQIRRSATPEPPAHEKAKEDIVQRICQLYARGESTSAVARRLELPLSRVRRYIAEMRYRRISGLPLEWIPNEGFERVRSAAREQAILGAAPENPTPARKVRRPAGLPPYLAALYEIPLLSREQEGHLFRKMNYLKYKAAKLRGRLAPKRPSMRLMDKIDRLYDQAVGTKNEILQANLRLVVSLARRYVGKPDEFFELVSDGNMSLIRAVEKFDFARGNKFSTYASWAIIKNFARTIPGEYRHRARFRTGQEEMFPAAADQRSDQYAEESAQAKREAQVARILEHLEERERRIIAYRFGLGSGQQPLTLQQVGHELGVTKERIRQLETRAMNKLRAAAEEEHVELEEIHG